MPCSEQSLLLKSQQEQELCHGFHHYQQHQQFHQHDERTSPTSTVDEASMTLDESRNNGNDDDRINIELVEKVQAMLKQEEALYSYRQYFRLSNNQSIPDDKEAYDSLLNVSWREKIVQWSYNVVDHFDLSREVVAVSLDLFDRYLATRGNECTGNMALLTSLTTLYIAMKLNDPKKIELDTLANLSRGQFLAQDVTRMEWDILSKLEWKLHPPTASTFVSHLLLFLPEEVEDTHLLLPTGMTAATQPPPPHATPIRKEISEISKYLTELAVCDSYFVDQSNSIVAYAAILNVMEDLSEWQLPIRTRNKFLFTLHESLGLSSIDPRVLTARSRIRAMYKATSACNNQATTAAATEATAAASSVPNEHRETGTIVTVSTESSASTTSGSTFSRVTATSSIQESAMSSVKSEPSQEQGSEAQQRVKQQRHQPPRSHRPTNSTDSINSLLNNSTGKGSCNKLGKFSPATGGCAPPAVPGHPQRHHPHHPTAAMRRGAAAVTGFASSRALTSSSPYEASTQ